MNSRPKIYVFIFLGIVGWICIGDSVSRLYAAPRYRNHGRTHAVTQLDVQYAKKLSRLSRRRLALLERQSNLSAWENIHPEPVDQDLELWPEDSKPEVELQKEKEVEAVPEVVTDFEVGSDSVPFENESPKQPEVMVEEKNNAPVKENKEIDIVTLDAKTDDKNELTGVLVEILRSLAFSFKDQKDKPQVQREDNVIRLDPAQMSELKEALMPKQPIVAPGVIVSKEAIVQESDDEDDEDEIPVVRRRRSGRTYEEPMGQNPVAPSAYMPQSQQMYQQPMVMYQQPQQNNMNQASAAAMQLQSSAMAMQAQASALMNQAQAQPQQTAPMIVSAPFAMQQPRPQPVLGSPNADMTKQEKINLLMGYVQRIAESEHKLQRLLMVLDLEFDIIEHLLGGTNGRPIEKKVQYRKEMVQESSPIVKTAYELIIDLSTSQGKEDDVELYRFFVRKGKQQKDATKQGPPASGKKMFLQRMLKSLQRYYEMIENMQNVVDAA